MLEAIMWQEPTRLITMKERDMLIRCLTIKNRAPVVNQRVGTCFECGSQGHFKKDYPKLKKQNCGKKAGTRQIKLEGRHIALLDAIPSTLDVSYAIELADGRVTETNIMLRGCTLGLLGHPFNIDLMPAELGSFNVIIGMDWLANHHAVIVYDEKIMRIPYGDEKYIKKGCQTFLAQVTKKEAKDKSEEKRLEDVPIVQDFSEVSPEDLPGLPPTRQERIEKTKRSKNDQKPTRNGKKTKSQEQYKRNQPEITSQPDQPDTVLAIGYAVMTTRSGKLDTKMRALRVLPIFVLPVISWALYSGLKSLIGMYPTAKATVASVLASKLGADSGLQFLVDESLMNHHGIGKSSDVELMQSSGLRRRTPSEAARSPGSNFDKDSFQYAGSEVSEVSLPSELIVDHQTPVAISPPTQECHWQIHRHSSPRYLV
ncbi:putative reverse transcriptase domain-containing protein [Tanacetum coccineum]